MLDALGGEGRPRSIKRVAVLGVNFGGWKIWVSSVRCEFAGERDLMASSTICGGKNEFDLIRFACG